MRHVRINPLYRRVSYLLTTPHCAQTYASPSYHSQALLRPLSVEDQDSFVTTSHSKLLYVPTYFLNRPIFHQVILYAIHPISWLFYWFKRSVHSYISVNKTTFAPLNPYTFLYPISISSIDIPSFLSPTRLTTLLRADHSNHSNQHSVHRISRSLP